MIYCMIFEEVVGGEQVQIGEVFSFDSVPALGDILRLQIDENKKEFIECKVSYSARISSKNRCMGHLMVRRV